MSVEHLRPLLENQKDAERFWMMGQELANASVPDEIIQVKPSGGVRGIVTGDIIRRLVVRTISRQIGPSIETATAPFQ